METTKDLRKWMRAKGIDAAKEQEIMDKMRHELFAKQCEIRAAMARGEHTIDVPCVIVEPKRLSA